MNVQVGATAQHGANSKLGARSKSGDSAMPSGGSNAVSHQPNAQATSPHAVTAAVDFILSRRMLQPQVAIILGSGLGGLAEDLTHTNCLPYADIPSFNAPHAVGHAGQLILGYLSGVPVVVMQGRCHRYEGHSHESVCFPVRVMQALGASVLVVTNASGGLNPRYRPGDLMLVDQHINCLWPRNHARQELGLPATSDGATGRETSPAAAPGQLRTVNEVYDDELLDRARRIALRHEIALHRGTYVSTLGPTYETRSEYRMFRWMGGDAVGMSTVPEVLTARQLGMRVLALSVITNVACTDSLKGTTHEEVVQCGKSVEPKLRCLVQQLLEEMAGPAD